MPPGIAQSALIVGRTPRSAADAPVGLLALCMMLTQLFQPRDEASRADQGVVRPTVCAGFAVLGKTSGIGLATCPTCSNVPYRIAHTSRSCCWSRPSSTWKTLGLIASISPVDGDWYSKVLTRR